jgi:hypothetical protein
MNTWSEKRFKPRLQPPGQSSSAYDITALKPTQNSIGKGTQNGNFTRPLPSSVRPMPPGARPFIPAARPEITLLMPEEGIPTNWTNLQGTPDERLVYEHLLSCLNKETPAQTMDRFRTLFFNGFGYPDWSVQGAIDRITAAANAQEDFKLFFNRCCHILINRWQSRLPFQYAIPEFFSLLESPIAIPVAGMGRSQSIKRLRLLVKSYVQGEHYCKLRRIAEFMLDDESDISGILKQSKPLISLIRRYPYLYSHCLLSESSSQDQKQAVWQAQEQVKKKFELSLSQYLTYELRSAGSSGRLIEPVKNPTLLTGSELKVAVKHFVGKVEGKSTYQDLSNRFMAKTSQVKSHQVFKRELYDYLVGAGSIQFGGGRFNKQLCDYLEALPGQGSDPRLNEFLMVRTCNQVVNFLVVESSQRANHYVFMDLLNNIGTAATMGLLLKLVLFCKKVKPHLEKRFAILFNHYEGHNRNSVTWLVNCLEHLNIAWSTHFSSQDFSFVNQIP